MKIEKIPTTEEFLETKHLPLNKEIFNGYNMSYSYLQSLLIEFTKLHVHAAIRAASDQARLSKNGSNVPYGEHTSEKCGTWTINKDSILSAYPLENIK